MPADALVAIGASRYSVPVRYVGAQVKIRETTTGHEILHQDTVIARHARAERHQVVMDPTHYAGLLRPSTNPDPVLRELENQMQAEAFVEILLSRRGGDSLASTPLLEEWIFASLQLYLNQSRY